MSPHKRGKRGGRPDRPSQLRHAQRAESVTKPQGDAAEGVTKPPESVTKPQGGAAEGVTKPPESVTKPQGGRPRQHWSHAERQRAYRGRNRVPSEQLNLPKSAAADPWPAPVSRLEDARSDRQQQLTNQLTKIPGSPPPHPNLVSSSLLVDVAELRRRLLAFGFTDSTPFLIEHNLAIVAEILDEMEANLWAVERGIAKKPHFGYPALIRKGVAKREAVALPYLPAVAPTPALEPAANAYDILDEGTAT